VIFWGVAEPLSHLPTPPMDMAEAGSPEAGALGLQYTIFHWGLHPWALYGVVGLALAYATFRKGRSNLLSSIVFPKKDPGTPPGVRSTSSVCSSPPSGRPPRWA
jgi:choline-glycine betaine transporter